MIQENTTRLTTFKELLKDRTEELLGTLLDDYEKNYHKEDGVPSGEFMELLQIIAVEYINLAIRYHLVRDCAHEDFTEGVEVFTEALSCYRSQVGSKEAREVLMEEFEKQFVDKFSHMRTIH